MNKREITEIKRRLKKESCTITKMCGCYVDSSKEKVTTFRNTFLNLEDDEFHKYLEIANKALSGKPGNNLLELSFSTENETTPGSTHQALMALRASHLEDDGLLDAFYDHVISSYDFVGNYLILLFHDTYDVPMKTTDNLALDESEEVYEYIICAICPVSLSKPGLGYKEDENSIGALSRDWVVGPTDTAFTFPAFTERSADIHSVLVYAKDPKDPHKEFWENGLGVNSRLTSAEKKHAFSEMVETAAGPDEEESEDIVINVQTNLNSYLEEEIPLHEKDDPVILDDEKIVPILTDSGLSEEKANKVKESFSNFFQEELPAADELIDTKVLKDNEVRVEKKELQKKVVELTDALEEAGVISSDGEKIDVVLKVDPKKIDEISATFVDGRKCLVIPLEEDDSTMINGQPMSY